MRSIEWAAGLFEGEGCITRSRNQQGKWYYRLIIGMNDEDVIRAFMDVIGCGKYYFRPRQKEHWNDTHTCYVCAKADVRRVLSQLLPYFGNRRAYKALNILDNLELST